MCGWYHHSYSSVGTRGLSLLACQGVVLATHFLACHVCINTCTVVLWHSYFVLSVRFDGWCKESVKILCPQYSLVNSLCLLICHIELTLSLSLSPPLDNIRVMVILWRLRGNIIRTALCWVVWHNVHSQQHTYVSSSYRSGRLGLSHWDP